MPTINELIWDDGNLDHIEDDKGFLFEEVEQAIIEGRRHAFMRRGRLLIIGKAEGGDYITVVLEERGRGKWRPITAWPSDKKEIRLANRQFARSRG